MQCFGFRLFGVFSASWTCRVMSFAKFGKFQSLLLLKNVTYLLILAVLGPLRRGLFSSCGEQGLRSSCSVRASPCCGFSCHGARALEHLGFSSCGSWAQFLWRMWDLPGPGIEPMSPALAGGFFTVEALALTSLTYLSIPFSPSSGTPRTTWRFYCHCAWSSHFFFSLLSWLLRLGVDSISCPQVHWFYLLSSLLYYCAPPVRFIFPLHFSVP